MVKLLLAQWRGVERMLQVSTRNVKTVTLERMLLLHHRFFLMHDGPAMPRMVVILHDVHGGVCFLWVGFAALEGNPRHIILPPLLEETCFLFEGADDGIWHILITWKQRSRKLIWLRVDIGRVELGSALVHESGPRLPLNLPLLRQLEAIDCCS